MEKEYILYSLELLDQPLMRSVTLNKSIDEIFALFFDRLYIAENVYSNMSFAFK